MPWCPSCRSEYEESASVCSDCGIALTSTPPQDEEKPIEELSEPTPGVSENFVFFKSVTSDIEANILKSLLNSYGIPVMKKYGEAGTTLILYAGSTNFGVDLFVPENMLSKAEDITNAQTDLTDEEIATDYGSGAESKNEKDNSGFNKAYKIVVAIIIILIVMAAFLSFNGPLFR